MEVRGGPRAGLGRQLRDTAAYPRLSRWPYQAVVGILPAVRSAPESMAQPQLPRRIVKVSACHRAMGTGLTMMLTTIMNYVLTIIWPRVTGNTEAHQ